MKNRKRWCHNYLFVAPFHVLTYQSQNENVLIYEEIVKWQDSFYFDFYFDLEIADSNLIK